MMHARIQPAESTSSPKCKWLCLRSFWSSWATHLTWIGSVRTSVPESTKSVLPRKNRFLMQDASYNCKRGLASRPVETATTARTRQSTHLCCPEMTISVRLMPHEMLANIPLAPINRIQEKHRSSNSSRLLQSTPNHQLFQELLILLQPDCAVCCL